MELNTEQIGDVTIIHYPEGVLDVTNTKKFKDKCMALITQHRKLVINFELLTFIDSSGFGCLLSCLRTAATDGRELKLCSMSKSVMTMFELVRMHRVIDIFNTQEEAVRSFQS